MNIGMLTLHYPRARAAFLWKLLAGLQATLSVWLVQATQHNPSLTLLAVVVWGGAAICMEDQLDQLNPTPSRASWLAGLTLMALSTWRSLLVLDKDTTILVLPLLQGISLALLLQPIRQLARQGQPLLVLSLFPLQDLASRFLPDFWLSALTAKLTQIYLLLFGLNAASSGRLVQLGQRGVQVMGACNSIDLIAQLTTIAVVFVLAFPIRSRALRISFISIAPVLAIMVNAGRIAILAALNASTLANRDALFTFMHEEWGSLIFAGIATMILGQFYMALIERELRLRRG